MPTAGGSKSTEEVVIVTMPAHTPRTSFEDAPDWKLAYVGRDEHGRRIIAIFEDGETPA